VENLAATVLVPADMPSAARVLFDPGALAFSDVSFAALVAGRLVVSSSSIDLPTAARATATPWGAPLAAGVTAALAPRGRPVRASVSFAYLRIAETFDAHTVHGAESASDAVDAANGADAWQAAAAADVVACGVGVRFARWLGVGVQVGAQMIHSHARATSTIARPDPPGSPAGAEEHTSRSRRLTLDSSVTPSLAYGVSVRPLRSLEMEWMYRPPVTVRWHTAAYDTSGLSEIYYPGNTLFRSDRWSDGVTFDNATSRSDACLSGRFAVRSTNYFLTSMGYQRIGSSPTTIYSAAPDGDAPASLVVRPAVWTTLWRVEGEVHRRDGLAARAGFRHVLRGGWRFDGTTPGPVRGGGPYMGATASRGGAVVDADAAILTFHDAIALPAGAALPASRRLREVRVSLVLTWRRIPQP
jgi:hypothetical protein